MRVPRLPGFKSLPSFGRFRKRQKYRYKMQPGFRIGPLERHGDYLANRCSVRTNNKPATFLGAVDANLQQRNLFRTARAQYRREEGDHWGEGLPGDCENQCFWFLVQSRLLHIDLSDFRLAIVETDAGEDHALLLVLREDQTYVVDFRLIDPFLPLGHPAFEKYRFRYMSKPFQNDWVTCLKRRLAPAVS